MPKRDLRQNVTIQTKLHKKGLLFHSQDAMGLWPQNSPSDLKCHPHTPIHSRH